jgi:hypothetical protein
MNHLNEESTTPNAQHPTPGVAPNTQHLTPEVVPTQESTANQAAVLTTTSRTYLRTALYWFLGAGAAGILVMALILKLAHGLVLPIPALIVFLLYLPCLPFAIFLSKSRKLSRHRADVKALVDAQDVRYIGALVDALTLEDPPCQRIALNGLIEILPRMKPEHADLLDSVHRTTLTRILTVPVERTRDKFVHEMLKPNTDPKRTAIRVSILKAFARVGDASALPIVLHLAERQGITDSEKEIERAALECLPMLKERVERQIEEETLLRPAMGRTPDTLLRPAHDSLEDNPNMLLRPSNEEDEEGDQGEKEGAAIGR